MMQLSSIFSSKSEQHLKIFLPPDCSIYFAKNYGRENSDHRTLIRSDIIKNFGESWSLDEKKNFLDLKKIPKAANGFVSISHTDSCGAWIFSSQGVGIDLELTKNISDKTVTRIGNTEEIDHTHKFFPSLAPLWTAKEASFKALNPLSDIKVLSQIDIIWLKKISISQNETILLSQVQTDKKNSCNGFTVINEQFCFSVMILRS